MYSRATTSSMALRWALPDAGLLAALGGIVVFGASECDVCAGGDVFELDFS